MKLALTILSLVTLLSACSTGSESTVQIEYLSAKSALRSKRTIHPAPNVTTDHTGVTAEVEGYTFSCLYSQRVVVSTDMISDTMDADVTYIDPGIIIGNITPEVFVRINIETGTVTQNLYPKYKL